jgi:hypothetical protein
VREISRQFVTEANGWQDLGKIISPLNHAFKMDVKVSPAIPLEQFGKAIQITTETTKEF